MVGQAADLLLARLIADLRPAQHHLDVGPQGFQQAHDLGGFHHVPDVNAQPNHGRIERQQVFDNLRRPLLDDEFAQLRASAQPRAAVQVHVGRQAPQAQRCVDVFGIEGGQNDARRHGGGLGRRAVHGRIIKP